MNGGPVKEAEGTSEGSGSEQFDRRFRLRPGGGKAVENRAERDGLIAGLREYLQSLRFRPANMSYFESCLTDEFGDESRPQVGYFCNRVPTGVIQAMGALAVRLDAVQASCVCSREDIVSFGAAIQGTRASRCCALVVAGSCAMHGKLAEILADSAPTFLLNMPPEENPSTYLAAASAELQRMADFLAPIIGRRLSSRRLLQAVRLGQRRSELVRRLLTIRAENPSSLSSVDLYTVIQASSAGVDFEEWCQQASDLADEIGGKNIEAGKRRPRVLLTGVPLFWPDLRVLQLIEECGASVVADAICSGIFSCCDPAIVDETNKPSLLRALALQAMFSPFCPCAGAEKRRLGGLLGLIGEFRVDGIIHYSPDSCAPAGADADRLSAVLRQRQIPLFHLSSGQCGDPGMAKQELNGFLDALR